MSIVCYTGLPGDGKSYSAVENFVIPALKDGRAVHHNLQLNVAALSVVCDRDVTGLLHEFSKDATPEEVIASCPPGAVSVIDEVWRYWPAGIKTNEVPKSELKFFKEHRHRVGEDGKAAEILIIDQDPKTGVPAFLRALIELTYLHTKQTKVGFKGRFRVDVFTRCQSAEKPAKSAKIRSLHGKYRPQVWNCYISHTQSTRLGEAGLEKMPDGRGNLLKGWTVKSAIIALVLMPPLLKYAWDDFRALARGGALKESARADLLQQASPIPQPVQGPAVQVPASLQQIAATLPAEAPQAAPAPTPNPRSNVWQISGVVWRQDGSGLAYLRSEKGTRRVTLDNCSRDQAGEWECLVDGERVEGFTGFNRYLSGALPPGVTGSVP